MDAKFSSFTVAAAVPSAAASSACVAVPPSTGAAAAAPSPTYAAPPSSVAVAAPTGGQGALRALCEHESQQAGTAFLSSCPAAATAAAEAQVASSVAGATSVQAAAGPVATVGTAAATATACCWPPAAPEAASVNCRFALQSSSASTNQQASPVSCGPTAEQLSRESFYDSECAVHFNRADFSASSDSAAACVDCSFVDSSSEAMNFCPSRFVSVLSESPVSACEAVLTAGAPNAAPYPAGSSPRARSSPYWSSLPAAPAATPPLFFCESVASAAAPEPEAAAATISASPPVSGAAAPTLAATTSASAATASSAAASSSAASWLPSLSTLAAPAGFPAAANGSDSSTKGYSAVCEEVEVCGSSSAGSVGHPTASPPQCSSDSNSSSVSDVCDMAAAGQRSHSSRSSTEEREEQPPSAHTAVACDGAAAERRVLSGSQNSRNDTRSAGGSTTSSRSDSRRKKTGGSVLRRSSSSSAVIKNVTVDARDSRTRGATSSCNRLDKCLAVATPENRLSSLPDEDVAQSALTDCSTGAGPAAAGLSSSGTEEKHDGRETVAASAGVASSSTRHRRSISAETATSAKKPSVHTDSPSADVRHISLPEGALELSRLRREKADAQEIFVDTLSLYAEEIKSLKAQLAAVQRAAAAAGVHITAPTLSAAAGDRTPSCSPAAGETATGKGSRTPLKSPFSSFHSVSLSRLTSCKFSRTSQTRRKRSLSHLPCSSSSSSLRSCSSSKFRGLAAIGRAASSKRGPPNTAAAAAESESSSRRSSSSSSRKCSSNTSSSATEHSSLNSSSNFVGEGGAGGGEDAPCGPSRLQQVVLLPLGSSSSASGSAEEGVFTTSATAANAAASHLSNSRFSHSRSEGCCVFVAQKHCTSPAAAEVAALPAAAVARSSETAASSVCSRAAGQHVVAAAAASPHAVLGGATRGTAISHDGCVAAVSPAGVFYGAAVPGDAAETTRSSTARAAVTAAAGNASCNELPSEGRSSSSQDGGQREPRSNAAAIPHSPPGRTAEDRQCWMPPLVGGLVGDSAAGSVREGAEGSSGISSSSAGSGRGFQEKAALQRVKARICPSTVARKLYGMGRLASLHRPTCVSSRSAAVPADNGRSSSSTSSTSSGSTSNSLAWCGSSVLVKEGNTSRPDTGNGGLPLLLLLPGNAPAAHAASADPLSAAGAAAGAESGVTQQASAAAFADRQSVAGSEVPISQVLPGVSKAAAATAELQRSHTTPPTASSGEGHADKQKTADALQAALPSHEAEQQVTAAAKGGGDGEAFPTSQETRSSSNDSSSSSASTRGDSQAANRRMFPTPSQQSDASVAAAAAAGDAPAAAAADAAAAAPAVRAASPREADDAEPNRQPSSLLRTYGSKSWRHFLFSKSRSRGAVTSSLSAWGTSNRAPCTEEEEEEEQQQQQRGSGSRGIVAGVASSLHALAALASPRADLSSFSEADLVSRSSSTSLPPFAGVHGSAASVCGAARAAAAHLLTSSSPHFPVSGGTSSPSSTAVSCCSSRAAAGDPATAAASSLRAAAQTRGRLSYPVPCPRRSVRELPNSADAAAAAASSSSTLPQQQQQQHRHCDQHQAAVAAASAATAASSSSSSSAPSSSAAATADVAVSSWALARPLFPAAAGFPLAAALLPQPSTSSFWRKKVATSPAPAAAAPAARQLASPAPPPSSSSAAAASVLLAATWIDVVLRDWDNQRHTQRFKKLLQEGVPHEVRGEVWKKAVGDQLRLNPRLYEMLLGRVQHVRQYLMRTSRRYRDRINETMETADADGDPGSSAPLASSLPFSPSPPLSSPSPSPFPASSSSSSSRFGGLGAAAGVGVVGADADSAAHRAAGGDGGCTATASSKRATPSPAPAAGAASASCPSARSAAVPEGRVAASETRTTGTCFTSSSSSSSDAACCSVGEAVVAAVRVKREEEEDEEGAAALPQGAAAPGKSKSCSRGESSSTTAQLREQGEGNGLPRDARVLLQRRSSSTHVSTFLSVDRSADEVVKMGDPAAASLPALACRTAAAVAPGDTAAALGGAVAVVEEIACAAAADASPAGEGAAAAQAAGATASDVQQQEEQMLVKAKQLQRVAAAGCDPGGCCSTSSSPTECCTGDSTGTPKTSKGDAEATRNVEELFSTSAALSHTSYKSNSSVGLAAAVGAGGKGLHGKSRLVSCSSLHRAALPSTSAPSSSTAASAARAAATAHATAAAAASLAAETTPKAQAEGTDAADTGADEGASTAAASCGEDAVPAAPSNEARPSSDATPASPKGSLRIAPSSAACFSSAALPSAAAGHPSAASGPSATAAASSSTVAVAPSSSAAAAAPSAAAALSAQCSGARICSSTTAAGGPASPSPFPSPCAHLCAAAPLASSSSSFSSSSVASFACADGLPTSCEGQKTAAFKCCCCGFFNWEGDVFAAFNSIALDLHRTLPRLGACHPQVASSTFFLSAPSSVSCAAPSPCLSSTLAVSLPSCRPRATPAASPSVAVSTTEAPVAAVTSKPSLTHAEAAHCVQQQQQPQGRSASDSSTPSRDQALGAAAAATDSSQTKEEEVAEEKRAESQSWSAADAPARTASSDRCDTRGRVRSSNSEPSSSCRDEGGSRRGSSSSTGGTSSGSGDDCGSRSGKESSSESDDRRQQPSASSSNATSSSIKDEALHAAGDTQAFSGIAATADLFETAAGDACSGSNDNNVPRSSSSVPSSDSRRAGSTSKKAQPSSDAQEATGEELPAPAVAAVPTTAGILIATAAPEAATPVPTSAAAAGGGQGAATGGGTAALPPPGRGTAVAAVAGAAGAAPEAATASPTAAAAPESAGGAAAPGAGAEGGEKGGGTDATQGAGGGGGGGKTGEAAGGRRVLSDSQAVPPVPFSLPASPTLYEYLRCVLEAYAMFRPDVGYVQGMAYIAATLLLYMDEYSTFVTFSNLLTRRSLHAFYTFDMGVVEVYFRTFDVLLREKLPLVASHFADLGIESDVFLVEWMYTLFTRALPFELVGRVWDLFFVEGDCVLFQTALAILAYFQHELRQGSLDDCMALLSSSSTTHIQALQVDTFLACFNSMEVSAQRLESLMLAVQASLAKEKQRRQKSLLQGAASATPSTAACAAGGFDRTFSAAASSSPAAATSSSSSTFPAALRFFRSSNSRNAASKRGPGASGHRRSSSSRTHVTRSTSHSEQREEKRQHPSSDPDVCCDTSTPVNSVAGQ